MCDPCENIGSKEEWFRHFTSPDDRATHSMRRKVLYQITGVSPPFSVRGRCLVEHDIEEAHRDPVASPHLAPCQKNSFLDRKAVNHSVKRQQLLMQSPPRLIRLLQCQICECDIPWARPIEQYEAYLSRALQ